MKQACEKLGMAFSSFSRKAKKLGVYKTNQFWNKGKSIFSDYTDAVAGICSGSVLYFCAGVDGELFCQEENILEDIVE